MIKSTFEAIVVGSGATGGVAALTLAEKGVKVLVIEAGPSLTLEKAIGGEPQNTIRRIQGLINGERRRQAQHPGYWKANPLLFANEIENPYTFPTDNPFYWTQGRQVGGRSLTWGGITLRLSENEFTSYDNESIQANWPISYKDLSEHYSEIEKRLRVYGKCDNLQQLPDGQYFDYLPFTNGEELLAKKVISKLNYPVIHSRGFGPNDHRKSKWPSSSSPGSTLLMALKTGNVEILSNHMVQSINMNKNSETAKGVVVIDQENGNIIELNSKLIVLCASTIQSIRILLNSEKSNKAGGFTDPSSSLGCNLMDHISTCRFFSMPKSNNYQKDFELSGAGSFFIPFGSNYTFIDKPNFLGGYGLWGGIDRFGLPKWLKRDPSKSLGFLIGHGEVIPNRKNKVTLSSKKDKWNIPVPHIEIKWRANEHAMAIHMNKRIQEVIQAANGEIKPLSEFVKMPFLEPIINKGLALQEVPPPPGYYIHEVGGAPMGRKETNSVLDQWNRLWRCSNVLVVDGACWPTSGWQSPTLTMMAITRRACLQALKHQVD